MTEGVLVVLILVAASAVLAVQVISVIREWRRLKNLPASRPTNFGQSFDAVGDFFRGLTGWLFYALVGLVALFGIIWEIKRMWEVA